METLHLFLIIILSIGGSFWMLGKDIEKEEEIHPIKKYTNKQLLIRFSGRTIVIFVSSIAFATIITSLNILWLIFLSKF